MTRQNKPLLPSLLSASLCAAVALYAADAHAQRAERSALAQPFRDLGVVRDHVPAVLARAAAQPYAQPARQNGHVDCAALTTEIAALDEALGPDLGMQINRDRTMHNLVNGAVRSAVDLPYRSVVRRLTGAERRDREISSAEQAGMVRRAFLKGVRDGDCNAPMSAPDRQELASVSGAIAAQTFADVEPAQAQPEVPQTQMAAAPETATPDLQRRARELETAQAAAHAPQQGATLIAATTAR